MNDQGRRNIWVANGPDFAARQITSYAEDDGQEIGSLSLTLLTPGNFMVDETHSLTRHENVLKANAATVEFLERFLGKPAQE